MKETLVLLFHGYGANKEDLEPLASFFPNADTLSLDAPLQLNHVPGMPFGARTWFDIDFIELQTIFMSGDLERLKSWKPAGFEKLVQTQCQRVLEASKDYQRVVFFGFSQGGMVATHLMSELGKISSFPLQGVFLSSSGPVATQLLDRESLKSLNDKAQAGEFELYQSHGRQDPVLPLMVGQALHQELFPMFSKMVYTEFDGLHQVSIESLRYFSTALKL